MVSTDVFGLIITQLDESRAGPVIRITPDEIHIDDAEWNDALYAKNHKQNKYEWMSGRFGNNSSVFTTADASLHRIRRAPLNPM